jgi:biopolymer transport protein ExbB
MGMAGNSKSYLGIGGAWAGILLGGAASASGQATGAVASGRATLTDMVGGAGGADALRETMSLAEILETGGWPLWVLGAMSVLGFALTLYFLLVLRQGQLMPDRFMGEIQGLLKAGRLREARETCSDHRCAAAAIARSAIDYAIDTESPDAALVKEIIEGEGGRQAGHLRDQIQYLHDIAVIAPMVGLLGTVMGMLSAFNAVALDIAKAKPMVLAHGVSQALITTAAGLIVGIPAMMAFAFFRGRTARLISALEAAAADMLTALVRGRAP